MKLFNAITAAAVIGASFITANPAEARNGWVYIGKGDRTGITHYVKKTGYQGGLVKFQWRTANDDNPFNDPFLADCNAWSYKDLSYSKSSWEDALPRTMADFALEAVCR